MYLLPIPKEIKIEENKFIIPFNSTILLDSLCSMDVYHYAKILQEDILKNLGFSLPIIKGNKRKGSIYLFVNEMLNEEEYHLSVTEEGIVIAGGNDSAILYGIQTLRQILSQEAAVLSCLEIKDAPSIKNRGFYHDVARGRIPTLSYLKAFADKLSYYKINQLQLYVEHSYLFQDFSEVWRDDTPLTAEEILELDEYCKKINIELVPSLSTFGHMFKILNTKTYEELCELPIIDSAEFSFINRLQHHTIDVSNSESVTFVKKMIEEFLPLFSSNLFNICADETFDLGKGRSKHLADKIGIKKMYIGHIKELCEYLIGKGKRPMFWGDILWGFPDEIKNLPSEVICLNWGYLPQQREDETLALHNAGATQYICPGVGGWNQWINLIESSYENISRMCTYAHKYNALGVLNTDWGDFGHINHPEFSTTGMIYGACFSWNETIPSYEVINKQISLLEYKDVTKNIVSIIDEISKCSIFGWNLAIWFKEVHSKKEIEVQKELFFETDFSNLQEANDKLDDLLHKLYEVISTMDRTKRSYIKAYLVATEGIRIFNTIAATMSEYKFGVENPASVNPSNLASELEHWFNYYKETWRTTSKESELFCIQSVINWYADYLRVM